MSVAEVMNGRSSDAVPGLFLTGSGDVRGKHGSRSPVALRTDSMPTADSPRAELPQGPREET